MSLPLNPKSRVGEVDALTGVEEEDSCKHGLPLIKLGDDISREVIMRSLDIDWLLWRSSNFVGDFDNWFVGEHMLEL